MSARKVPQEPGNQRKHGTHNADVNVRQGLRAWHAMAACRDSKLRCRPAAFLLELMRFDLSGAVQSEVEEFERAVENERRNRVLNDDCQQGLERASQTRNVATHLVMNAERLKKRRE